MRADRLLSILMLLQARGRMTAQQLAREVEVSERTIYRDIDALCMAGVPIYADSGPGGGYALLDSYRTTLTGLNEEEVRALFMLNIPAPLTDLGVSGDLRSALLKLAASLPHARREEEAQVRQRIHLDSEAWFQSREPLPHLQTIQRAVWEDRRLQITLRLRFDAEVEWRVDPLGLVAKASLWYLVLARQGRVRAYRVSEVIEARLTEETFERPADFDLAAFWQDWRAKVESAHPPCQVTARVDPNLLPYLAYHFGRRLHGWIAEAGPPDKAGWLTLTLSFDSFAAARERVLGYGRAIEVLAPRALRLSVADYARQIADRYEGELG